MKPVLLIFGHPAFEKSRVNQRLISEALGITDVHLHDLYELYPDYEVDIRAEQETLLQYDRIILQHPFYWYNCPPLIKQWIDLVLEHGWAYGSAGTALSGKTLLHIVTTGGPEMAYQPSGFNRFSLRDFLSPFDQTFFLCGMNYAPPFAIQGTHRMQPDGLEAEARRYRQLIEAFRDGIFPEQSSSSHPLANSWLTEPGVR